MASAELVLSQSLSKVVLYPLHSAPATVVAKHDSQLTVDVSGIVRDILVDVGDEVKEGEPLLLLDDTIYKLSLRKAKVLMEGVLANIALVEYQLNQANKLGQKKNISEELLRQRDAELALLKSELEGLQVQRDLAINNIENCVLRAPFSGVLIARSAQLGQLATPGTDLLRLLGVTGQQVSAELHNGDSILLNNLGKPQLQLGQKLYNLQLKNILPMLHMQQRTQQIRLDFVNERALVGSAGRLLWRDHRPYLPAKYLHRRNGELGIFILEQEQVKFIALLDAQEGRDVLVDHLSMKSQLVTEKRLQFGTEGR